MILYHGSDVIVKDPKIIPNEKGKDFGCAFYLTPIKEQAERMAKRRQRFNMSKSAIVSVFEYDEKSAANLKSKKFQNADLEWLDLIIECRTNPRYKHGFDVIEGKIADDSVGETVLFVIDGVMRKEDALEKLKFQKINSQIALCTSDALKLIRFKKSYEVK